MNLLVTGGAGFIGSNYLHHRTALDARGCLVNLDKLTYAGNLANCRGLDDAAGYHFVKGDIGNVELVGNLLRSHQIDGVVNFAAESHVDRSIDSPGEFLETNVMGTYRLLESVRRYWDDLEGAARNRFRFVHVSTDEVYGSLNPGDPAFTEHSLYAPNSPYSASKAAGDHLVRAYRHTFGLPVITTNCSNNYGPRQFPEKLIPLMILNALEGKPLPVYGDGGNVRDWLYVEDHCRAVSAVLQEGRPGETYNIGGRHEMTNIDVVKTLCRLLDEEIPLAGDASYESLITFVEDRPGHDFRYAIDCRKIEEELHWRPRETFTSGLKKTVDWYLANMDWCRDIHRGRYQRQRLGTAGGARS